MYKHKSNSCINNLISLCSGPTYIHVPNRHACCTSKNIFHQRCHCAVGPISKCKNYCDNDDQCKGYVAYEFGNPGGSCQFATTSQCPSGCYEGYTGNLGELDRNKKTCGNNYGGCYIKTLGNIIYDIN